MVGSLQLKLSTSTLVGFLINGLIMNRLQHIFSQAENLVFQFQKSRGRIFLCVSPTFASPIEKPATSALRRICREIIGNREGNAKTVDSLRHCKKTSSASKSAPKTKKPTRRPVGGEFSKWCRCGDIELTFLRPPKMRIFQLPQDGVVYHLENFSERFVKIRTTSKSGLYIAKTLSKGFELATSICGLK